MQSRGVGGLPPAREANPEHLRAPTGLAGEGAEPPRGDSPGGGGLVPGSSEVSGSDDLRPRVSSHLTADPGFRFCSACDCIYKCGWKEPASSGLGSGLSWVNSKLPGQNGGPAHPPPPGPRHSWRVWGGGKPSGVSLTRPHGQPRGQVGLQRLGGAPGHIPRWVRSWGQRGGGRGPGAPAGAGPSQTLPCSPFLQGSDRARSGAQPCPPHPCHPERDPASQGFTCEHPDSLVFSKPIPPSGDSSLMLSSCPTSPTSKRKALPLQGGGGREGHGSSHSAGGSLAASAF